MNAPNIFGLAMYAHTELNHLMKPLNASLQIVLDFEPTYGALQVWVFENGPLTRAVAHKTGIKTKEQLDELVAEVKDLASVPA